MPLPFCWYDRNCCVSFSNECGLQCKQQKMGWGKNSFTSTWDIHIYKSIAFMLWEWKRNQIRIAWNTGRFETAIESVGEMKRLRQKEKTRRTKIWYISKFVKAEARESSSRFAYAYRPCTCIYMSPKQIWNCAVVVVAAAAFVCYFCGGRKW